MSRIFTTGTVSKICNVAPRTVAKWFDSGLLEGYRVPGSADRRIPLENLRRFMGEQGFPLDDLDRRTTLSLLLITSNPKLAAALSGDGRSAFVLHTATSSFDAGLQLATHLPVGVVLDCGERLSLQRCLCLRLKSLDVTHPLLLIAVAADEDEVAVAKQLGVDEIFCCPFKPVLFWKRVRSLLRQRRIAS